MTSQPTGYPGPPGHQRDAISLPSVLLHDHLDGGVRPRTIIDLAEAGGYEHLPNTDTEGLGAWFDQSKSGSLETYIQAFDHTIGVVQSPQVPRAGRIRGRSRSGCRMEWYVEIRSSPPLHTAWGLPRHRSERACVLTDNGRSWRQRLGFRVR